MTEAARAIYDRFRRLPGSEHIAKPNAIGGVIRHIKRTRPRAVLEVGAGIGTMTYAILSAVRGSGAAVRVVAIEDNAFCLRALQDNLKEDLGRVEIRPNAEGLPAGAFDLVIVDGGTLERNGYTELVARGGCVLVEGFREHQRRAMAGGRSYVFAEFWGDDLAEGGYWLYKFEPGLRDRLWFAVARARLRTRPWRQRLRRAFQGSVRGRSSA